MEARGEIDAATVKEFDAASKGKDLPERVGKKPRRGMSLEEAHMMAKEEMEAHRKSRR